MKLQRFLKKSLWAVLPKAGWYNSPLAPGHPRTHFSNRCCPFTLYLFAFPAVTWSLSFAGTDSEEILASRKAISHCPGKHESAWAYPDFLCQVEPQRTHCCWPQTLTARPKDVPLFNHGAKWNMSVFPVFTWQYRESTRSTRHGSG